MKERPNEWESSEYTWRCTCGAALGFGFDHTYNEIYPDAQFHAQANPNHRVFLGRKQERWVIPSTKGAGRDEWR